MGGGGNTSDARGTGRGRSRYKYLPRRHVQFSTMTWTYSVHTAYRQRTDRVQSHAAYAPEPGGGIFRWEGGGRRGENGRGKEGGQLETWSGDTMDHVKCTHEISTNTQIEHDTDLPRDSTEIHAAASSLMTLVYRHLTNGSPPWPMRRPMRRCATCATR